MTEPSHIPNLASCTYEMVHATAWANPDLFIKDGEISLYRTLFHLGFYIDNKDYLKGIRTTHDVLVRCHLQPDLVYTTTIFAGRCRRAVKFVKNGKPVYHKNVWHHRKTWYERNEVLQPDNIFEYIPRENMTNILEIGDIGFYNKKIK